MAYIVLLGIMLLILLGVVFTLFASTSKVKLKPDVEFDDLAPGLNIDLGYYVFDGQNLHDESKKKRKKREELLSLLSR